jgi:NAD(P)-dependent dehydrogenase (short-subunit alcohol dehydrogenase family)
MVLAKINGSSVFLVSGGGRGITAECVIRLAQKYQCRWILLGRSQIADADPLWAEGCTDPADLKKRIMQAMQAQGEKPTPMAVQKQFNAITTSRDIRKTLETLQNIGSPAEYVSVDVTDLTTLKRELAPVVDRMGAITGVIHGAGNLADKWIENKTEQDFENVYATKVQGLDNLIQCIPIGQLDHLVLFSSVAGFFGSAGQADYAIANEILNKSAHLIKLHHPDCHVVSINWGPWDSGMVTPELKRAFARRGIEVIPIEVGTQMLVNELNARYHDQAQVVIGSPIVPPPADLDGELRSYRIRRRLTVDANPFLRDHVIGGNPVLPATCAANWLISLCTQLHPGYLFSSLENFKVLKGIVFDGTQAKEFVADVQEVGKTHSEEVHFEVRLWSEQDNGKIRFHYSGQVKLRQELSPPPIHLISKFATHSAKSGLSYYQDKTLFHGVSFQGIREVLEIDDRQLTVQCYLPGINPHDQGQFLADAFNPYMADVLIQTVLIWLKEQHQSGALPTEIQQITQFKSLPFDRPIFALMETKVKTSTSIIYNVTACDEEGTIYLHLSGVKATISDRLSQLFGTLVSSHS